jgi:hypothetical protein
MPSWKQRKGAPGKGDVPRHIDKQLYDKHFDEILWRSRIRHGGSVKSVKKSVS